MLLCPSCQHVLLWHLWIFKQIRYVSEFNRKEITWQITTLPIIHRLFYTPGDTLAHILYSTKDSALHWGLYVLQIDDNKRLFSVSFYAVTIESCPKLNYSPLISLHCGIWCWDRRVKYDNMEVIGLSLFQKKVNSPDS